MNETFRNRFSFTSRDLALAAIICIALAVVAWAFWQSHAPSAVQSVRYSGDTVTVIGTLENAQMANPDTGQTYVVKTADGQEWSATNCGFINLPRATVDSVASGDMVQVYGKLGDQPHAINICGSSSYFVRRYLSGSDACTKYNIPVSSCAHATAAGYYCPSWDARPGEVASMICVNIKQ